MRNCIAIFLLVLFACQALPLAVMGKSVAKLQQAIADTDDAPDEDGDNSPPDASKLKKQSPLLEEDLLHHGTEVSVFCAIQASQILLLHRADHLPILYAGEVTSPPPDRC
jgi:hypothetical protein